MSSKYIPPKRTNQNPTKSAAPVIPTDLQDKWGAVQACATACNVLAKGMYSPEWLQAVGQTHTFLLKLYEQTVVEAAKHPQADLIPELKEFNNPTKKGATDGETTKTTDTDVGKTADSPATDTVQ